MPIEEARKRKYIISWDKAVISAPHFLGIKKFVDYPLEEIRERIDWTPFFRTWELKGRFPQILDDNQFGEADDSDAATEIGGGSIKIHKAN